MWDARLKRFHKKKIQELDALGNYCIANNWMTRVRPPLLVERNACFTSPARVLIKVRAEDYDNDAPLGKLRDATRQGNWWRAQSILRKHRFEVTIKINNVDETMLHLAVGEGKNYFVQKLLNSIQNEELIEEKNSKGQTALHIAALVGNKDAAELLVKKRNNMLYVKDRLGKVPLHIAYTTNHVSTFAYLFEATKTAGELLSKYQDSFEEFIIRLIYRKEYAWESTLWRMKRFKNNYYSWLLPEIVMLLLVARIKDIEKRKKEYEEVKYFLHNTVRHMDSCNLDNSLFYKFIALEALAIIYRSEKVYNHIFYPLIKQKESHRLLKDYSGNNLLQLVGRLAPSNVLSCTTGAALQLQRELQWREKFMEPMQLTDLNIDNETPEMVFTREHANLGKDGEKWMKATAESCSITAALIVTIVFAAAITVPGGSNQETGVPLFKKQIAFTVFAISDAISLFSASTSLLVFLSILTTRFAEKDFLLSLPRRLLIALVLSFL
ncbi:Ankyrin repeat-containing protein [Artemisia annua]|uniref:Ankyrin repeat-containing protein n=1 Tax=Artemisia annua TaxID=35608 RepID=A0A2U1N0D5_ARTAN|nr:Ankyrin repeat-containing protein [Artemisia annua]